MNRSVGQSKYSGPPVEGTLFSPRERSMLIVAIPSGGYYFEIPNVFEH